MRPILPQLLRLRATQRRIIACGRSGALRTPKRHLQMLKRQRVREIRRPRALLETWRQQCSRCLVSSPALSLAVNNRCIQPHQLRIRNHRDLHLGAAQEELKVSQARATIQALEGLTSPSVDAILDVAKDAIAESLDRAKGANVTDPGIYRAHAARYEKEVCSCPCASGRARGARPPRRTPTIGLHVVFALERVLSALRPRPWLPGAQFLEDMERLGVRPADVMPRVSEYMPEIVEYVQKIIAQGLAYESAGDSTRIPAPASSPTHLDFGSRVWAAGLLAGSQHPVVHRCFLYFRAVHLGSAGSVYFDTTSFREKGHVYGKLNPWAVGSALAAEGEVGGDFAAGGKRSLQDFALWKVREGLAAGEGWRNSTPGPFDRPPPRSQSLRGVSLAVRYLLFAICPIVPRVQRGRVACRGRANMSCC